MDSELLSEINKEMIGLCGIHEISDDKAAFITNAIAKKYIRDRSLIWWWEGLNQEYATIDYGDGYSWPIIDKIASFPNADVYLFVTDDEPEPWPIFKGPLDKIGKLLSELWRFEYFIADENLEWLIFDTHHNMLVVAGILKNVAEKEKQEGEKDKGVAH